MGYKISILLLLSLLVFCCVSRQKLVSRFSGNWVGRSFDEFVIQHGPPHKEFKLKDGGVIYTWSSESAGINTRGAVNGVLCEVQLVTDAEGVISNVKILRDSIGLGTTSRCYEVLK